MQKVNRAVWTTGILLGVIVMVGDGPATGQGVAQVPTPPAGKDQPPAGKDQPAQEKSPLDEPIGWLQEGKKSFANVQDYTCTLVKKEMVRGVMTDDHIISAKFRPQPFSVSMRWLAPNKFAGQEIFFVAGKNRNKMQVKSKGLLKGAAGFVSIDVNDRRVFEHSRHNITEAGLGNLLDQTLANWETERKLGKTQVKVAEYNFDNRRCIRIETIRTEKRDEYYCYRSVLYIDKDSKIPVRTENYDWPRQGGPAEGELIELYSFVGLRFNNGLGDRDFEPR